MSAKAKGLPRLVTDEWRKKVKAYLDAERGRSRQMSKDIKCSTSMITQLLYLSTDNPPGPQTSRIAADVAEWTGIPLPDDALLDEEIAALLEDAAALRAVSADTLRRAIASFRSIRHAAEGAVHSARNSSATLHESSGKKDQGDERGARVGKKSRR